MQVPRKVLDYVYILLYVIMFFLEKHVILLPLLIHWLYNVLTWQQLEGGLVNKTRQYIPLQLESSSIGLKLLNSQLQ